VRTMQMGQRQRGGGGEGGGVGSPETPLTQKRREKSYDENATSTDIHCQLEKNLKVAGEMLLCVGQNAVLHRRTKRTPSGKRRTDSRQEGGKSDRKSRSVARERRQNGNGEKKSKTLHDKKIQVTRTVRSVNGEKKSLEMFYTRCSKKLKPSGVPVGSKLSKEYEDGTKKPLKKKEKKKKKKTYEKKRKHRKKEGQTKEERRIEST